MHFLHIGTEWAVELVGDNAERVDVDRTVVTARRQLLWGRVRERSNATTATASLHLSDSRTDVPVLLRIHQHTTVRALLSLVVDRRCACQAEVTQHRATKAVAAVLQKHIAWLQCELLL